MTLRSVLLSIALTTLFGLLLAADALFALALIDDDEDLALAALPLAIGPWVVGCVMLPLLLVLWVNRADQEETAGYRLPVYMFAAVTLVAGVVWLWLAITEPLVGSIIYLGLTLIYALPMITLMLFDWFHAHGLATHIVRAAFRMARFAGAGALV